MKPLPKAYSYIRFSTPEQMKGTSLQRQLEASRKYAAERGFELDETMKDLGVSAYYGKQRRTLDQFLNFVKEGRVKQGSMLIVESFDRLSRENVLDADELFKKIIRAGIILVTLQDRMEYSKANIEKNWTQLIISIAMMARAHEENKIKGERIRDAHISNREKAVKGERTYRPSHIPAWLRETENGYEVIPERADVIRRIFHMRLHENKGAMQIAHELNEDKTILWKPQSPRSKSGKLPPAVWREQYVHKILYETKLVLGELAFGKYVRVKSKDGEREISKRIPEGQTVKQYPAIVDQDTYFSVQAIRKRATDIAGFGGGKKGNFNNVFIYVARCGFCDAPLRYVNNGNHGGIRLQCNTVLSHTVDTSTGKSLCTAGSIPYYEFMDTFFDRFAEVDINKLLPDMDAITARKKEIDKAIDSNKGQIQDLEVQIEGLLDIQADKNTSHGNRLLYDKRIATYRDKIVKLQESNIKLSDEYKTLKNPSRVIQESRDRINGIRQFLADRDHRQAMNGELQNLFEWIKVFPIQPKQERITRLQAEYDAAEAKINPNDPPPVYTPLGYLKGKLTRELDPYYEHDFSSKSIDTIEAQFKGGRFRLLRLRNADANL
jgi:DNA invertase Pin-like site-specific DNA recombinase